MTLTRAFTYYFDDPDWVTKLLIMLLITGFTVAFAPALIGLIGVVLLFGYQCALIRNVRANYLPTLPAWHDLGSMIMEGVPVLIAYVVYSLPNLFMGAFSWLVTTLSADTDIVSSGVILTISCCLLPFILLFNLVALPMFTMAQGEYAHSGNASVFFQLGALFDHFRTHFDAIVQWWIGMILFYLLMSFLAVTVIGIFAALAIAVPITGALAGMLYSATVDAPEKPKRK